LDHDPYLTLRIKPPSADGASEEDLPHRPVATPISSASTQRRPKKAAGLMPAALGWPAGG